LLASLPTRAEAWPCGGDPRVVWTQLSQCPARWQAEPSLMLFVLSGRNRQLANCLARPLSTERSSLSRPELLDVLVVFTPWFTARAALLLFSSCSVSERGAQRVLMCRSTPTAVPLTLPTKMLLLLQLGFNCAVGVKTTTTTLEWPPLCNTKSSRSVSHQTDSETQAATNPWEHMDFDIYACTSNVGAPCVPSRVVFTRVVFTRVVSTQSSYFRENAQSYE
jgi:hypothetical protein